MKTQKLKRDKNHRSSLESGSDMKSKRIGLRANKVNKEKNGKIKKKLYLRCKK